MAKGKIRNKKASENATAGSTPSGPAFEAFHRGDYARAHRLFVQESENEQESPSAREIAGELAATTRVDRVPLLVAGAGFALLGLIALVTSMTQP